MRLVVAMILAIVTFSSAATASGVWRAGQIPADPEIRLLILIHQFERVALHAPEGLLPVISRYESPLSYALVSDDRDALAIYGPVIERRMEQLAELTGQSATKSPAATATVNISLVPAVDVSRFVDGHLDLGPDPETDGMSFHCYGFALSGEHAQLERAAVAFATDIISRFIRHCIARELTRLVGLAGSSCFIRPSIFCPDDLLLELAWYDRLMIRVLYHPDLRAGTPRKEALATARQVIASYLVNEPPPGDVSP